MTGRDLIALLVTQETNCLDYDLFVSSPDNEDDFFVDSLAVNDTQKQLFIKTSQ